MQKKLGLYRQQLKPELRLSEKAGGEKKREEDQAQNTGKRSREMDELQDVALEDTVKRPKTVDNNSHLETEIDPGSGGLEGNGGSNATRGEVDDAVLVELAIQEAFDELGHCFVDDELEDLFTE